MMVCSAFMPKDKVKSVYLVGVSASFSDSTVYFTDIQLVESAEIHKKSKLLLNRNQYSEQLDNYLEQTKGLNDRTCFIYFDDNKADLEKSVKKIKEKYIKGGKSILRDLGSEFKFSNIED